MLPALLPALPFTSGPGLHGSLRLRAEKYLPPPPREQEKTISEANSGSIHPSGRSGYAVKTRKTISTIAIPWPVKAIFEKRAVGGGGNPRSQKYLKLANLNKYQIVVLSEGAFWAPLGSPPSKNRPRTLRTEIAAIFAICDATWKPEIAAISETREI